MMENKEDEKVDQEQRKEQRGVKSQGEGVRVRHREGWKKSERKTAKKRFRRS